LFERNLFIYKGIFYLADFSAYKLEAVSGRRIIKPRRVTGIIPWRYWQGVGAESLTRLPDAIKTATPPDVSGQHSRALCGNGA